MSITKRGKVCFAANSGGKGIKFEDETEVWYNPVEEIKEEISQKIIGKEVEIVLEDEQSTRFISLKVILNDDAVEKAEYETKKIPVERKAIDKKAKKEEPEVQEEESEIIVDETPFINIGDICSMTLKEVKELMKVKLKLETKENLLYANWAQCWEECKKLHPNATFKVYENKSGMPYFFDRTGGFVKVGVTIKGLEHISFLPIMDHTNKAIPSESINTFEINKSIQRALTKALGLHGLGLYVYNGKDKPEA